MANLQKLLHCFWTPLFFYWYGFIWNPNYTKYHGVISLCSSWCHYGPFILSIIYKARSMHKSLIFVALGMFISDLSNKSVHEGLHPLLKVQNKVLIISLHLLNVSHPLVHYWESLQRYCVLVYTSVSSLSAHNLPLSFH